VVYLCSCEYVTRSCESPKPAPASRRYVFNPRLHLAALASPRPRAPSESLPEAGLIFTTGADKPITPPTYGSDPLHHTWSAGVPSVRFHDLRHTCATLLLSRRVHPKIVQELLGHDTIAMTLDTYSHYLPSMGNQASGAMGDALG
jgi:integrase